VLFKIRGGISDHPFILIEHIDGETPYIQLLAVSTNFAMQCDIKSRKTYVASKDPLSAESEILLDKSFAFDLHGVSRTMWSKSLDRRFIGNGYDAFYARVSSRSIYRVHAYDFCYSRRPSFVIGRPISIIPSVLADD